MGTTRLQRRHVARHAKERTHAATQRAATRTPTSVCTHAHLHPRASHGHRDKHKHTRARRQKMQKTPGREITCTCLFVLIRAKCKRGDDASLPACALSDAAARACTTTGRKLSASSHLARATTAQRPGIWNYLADLAWIWKTRPRESHKLRDLPATQASAHSCSNAPSQHQVVATYRHITRHSQRLHNIFQFRSRKRIS